VTTASLARGARLRFADHQAFAIHGHRNKPEALRRERIARDPVAGILEPDPVAAVQRQRRHQTQGALVAGCDHDGLGRSDDAARHRQIAGDRLAQGGKAGGIGIGEGGAGQRAGLPRGDPRPKLSREKVQRGQAQLQRQGCAVR
jgi:hypothetical protein